MKSMREQLTKGILKHADSIAPAGGGGVGFLSVIAEWTPLISVASILIGLVLGIVSFCLKRQVQKLEILKLQRELVNLKKQ